MNERDKTAVLAEIDRFVEMYEEPGGRTNAACVGALRHCKEGVERILAAIVPPPAGDGMQPVAWRAFVTKAQDLARAIVRAGAHGKIGTLYTHANTIGHMADDILAASPLNAVPDGVREALRIAETWTQPKSDIIEPSREWRPHEVADDIARRIREIIVPSPSEGAEISRATFDILERMARDHPELRGGYARATSGVDIDLVVAVFANALHDAEIAALEPSPSNSRAKAMGER